METDPKDWRCKTCKWWVEWTPLSGWGRCTHGNAMGHLDIKNRVGDEELEIHAEFGCRFWQGKEASDD